MTRLRLLLITIFVALVSIPATALATDGTVTTQSGAAEGAGGVTAQGGQLPFTGLNLVLILVGAAVLIGTGLLLRRRAANSR